MTTQPISRNCQIFINKLSHSKKWDLIKDLLLAWKEQNKQQSIAYDIFQQIAKAMDAVEPQDHRLLEAFNKCFLRDPLFTKKIIEDLVDPDLPRAVQVPTPTPISPPSNPTFIKK